MLGDGAFYVALAWQVYDLSPQPTALSVVLAARSIPMLLLLLVGGAITDRFPRRIVMLASDVIRGAAAALLAVLAATGAPRVGDRGAPSGARSGIFDEVREGYRYARAEPWIWVTLVVAAFSVLFAVGPFDVLMPLIVRDLRAGADAYGAIIAASGAGGILAALVVSQLGNPRRRISAMFLAWGIGSLAFGALALPPHPAWAVLVGAPPGCHGRGAARYPVPCGSSACYDRGFASGRGAGDTFGQARSQKARRGSWRTSVVPKAGTSPGGLLPWSTSTFSW